MLTFELEPAFLEHYSVSGFHVDHNLGEIGELVIYLQARQHSENPEFGDHVELQRALGEKVHCEFGAWRFVGTVEGLEYDGSSGDFRVIVRDALAPLSRTFASRVFADEKVEDIVAAIIPSDLTLNCIGDIGGRKIPLAIQYQESHLDFLTRLLAQNGGQIWCYGGELFVGSQASDEKIELRLGTDFLSYSFATYLGLEKVAVKSIGYGDKNKSNVRDVELAGASFGKVQDSAVDARLKSNGMATLHIVHEDSSYSDVEGLGECVLRSQASGRFTLTGALKDPVPLGAQLEISNFDKAGGGDKITENAVVRSLRGGSDPGSEDADWWVEVTNPDALLDGIGIPANQLLTSTAIVKESDDSMNRARIAFPWDTSETMTPWLRVTSPSWGAGHAHYIPPVVDDTVVVMWGQWDMDPIIAGAVAAGEEVATPTDRFVLQTVEGHKITIDGDTVRILNEANSGGTEVAIAPDQVTVKTKDGQAVEIGKSSIVLKDARGDSVELDGSRVLLKHVAGGSVELSAAKIAIQCKGEIDISNGVATINFMGPKVSINNGALDVI